MLELLEKISSNAIVNWIILLLSLTVFILMVVHLLVWKPKAAKEEREERKQRMTTPPGTPTGTPTGTPKGSLVQKVKTKSKESAAKLKDLAKKTKDSVAKHIATIKGKIIKIEGKFDDLSPEEQEEVKKCYKEGGCQF